MRQPAAICCRRPRTGGGHRHRPSVPSQRCGPPSGSTPSLPRAPVRSRLYDARLSAPHLSVAGRGAGAAGAIGARPSVREIGPLSPRVPRPPYPSPASARAGGGTAVHVSHPLCPGALHLGVGNPGCRPTELHGKNIRLVHIYTIYSYNAVARSGPFMQRFSKQRMSSARMPGCLMNTPTGEGSSYLNSGRRYGDPKYAPPIHPCAYTHYTRRGAFQCAYRWRNLQADLDRGSK